MLIEEMTAGPVAANIGVSFAKSMLSWRLASERLFAALGVQGHIARTTSNASLFDSLDTGDVSLG